MESIVAILVFAAMVYWGAWVAQKNHRNVPLAAFWSALFGIFAVGVYYIIGDKYNKRDIHKDVIDSQNGNKTSESSNL